MEADGTRMKSIWYFVGLMLLSMGAVVFLSGVYGLLFPESSTTVLAHLHPDLWWGAVMLVGGVVFYIIGKKNPVH